MAIRLITMNEFGEVLKECGSIDQASLQKIVSIAESEGMSCVSYIDTEGDTYFNEAQLQEAQKEINILSTYSDVSREVVELIQSAIRCALEQGSFTYLKFEHSAM